MFSIQKHFNVVKMSENQKKKYFKYERSVKQIFETVHNNTGEGGDNGKEEAEDVNQEELLIEVKHFLDIFVIKMSTCLRKIICCEFLYLDWTGRFHFKCGFQIVCREELNSVPRAVKIIQNFLSCSHLLKQSGKHKSQIF